MPATAALHYARDAYTAPRGVIYGRLRVSADFFSAFATHGAGDILHCVSPRREDAADLAERLGPEIAGRKPLVFVPEARFELLARIGAMMIYSPKLSAWATARQSRGLDRAFSLVGVTHSMSGPLATRWLFEYVTSPVHPWDALIATSSAAKTMIEATLEAHRDYLAFRLGVVAPPRQVLQVPVIPLGIDAQRLAKAGTGGAARSFWREALGIGADDVVALYLGRLSTRNKVNPFAMLRAAEIANRQTPFTFLMAGQFDDKESERGWRDAAAQVAPSVRIRFVDGATLDEKPPLWPAADFFVSLVDNIQETFGLAPVEALAAGLPVIASDWDGYKDTIEHGAVGFRVPTLVPGHGDGVDLAIAAFEAGPPEDTHVDYVADVAQSTAVDIGEAAAAMERLAGNASLRARMSAAATERALRLYDWPVVIRAYESLFEELAAIRAAHGRPVRHDETVLPPLYPDPYVQYRAFASASLVGSDRLAAADGLDIGFVRSVSVAQGGERFRLAAAETDGMLARIAAHHGISVAEALEPYPTATRSAAMRTIVWLMKVGLVVKL
jgi:starch synthase